MLLLLSEMSGRAAAELLRTAQVGARGRARGGMEGQRQLSLQSLVQDSLDRSVAVITEGQGPLAGGIEAIGAILVGQTDDALGLSQVVQRMLGEQSLYGLGHLRTQRSGFRPTPI